MCSVVSAELFVRMVARDAELSGLVHWRAVDEGGAAGGSGGGGEGWRVEPGRPPPE